MNMRIAGELSNIRLDEANQEVKVNMLKKSMEVQQDTSSQLLNSLVAVAQGIQESSPVGKNIDFYA
jgi:cystathionine beta-lyase family protein involved in aluminum resistance